MILGICEKTAGKNVVVTGSGSGVGFAIAKAFADSGSQVIIADLNIDEAKEKGKNDKQHENI
ncbi:SDR family NAD(P)-dependent oxidoreductase [Agathobacter sp.]